MEAHLIFILVLAVLLVFVLLASITTVKQGTECTVEMFGRFSRTLKPGLNWLIPFIERKGCEVNMKEQVLEIDTQSVITKDNASVDVNGIVFYEVQDAYAATYQIDDLDVAITNLAMTNLRTVIGSMEIDDLLSQRDVINQKLLKVMDEATVPWGTKITRVEIKDIDPPEDLVIAMASQMKAEREKRANILEAEGFKQAAVLKAEGEKQSAVLAAEAEKEVAFCQAEARERSAEAEAKAAQVVSDAIANGNAQSLNYFLGQAYVEALKEIVKAPNQKILMLPFETQQLASSLTGIIEVTKNLLEDKKK